MVEILFAESTLGFFFSSSSCPFLLSQHHTPIPTFRYGVSSTHFFVLFMRQVIHTGVCLPDSRYHRERWLLEELDSNNGWLG